MNARCETVGKYVLPVFRSLVAKELVITYNLTQVEAAKMLGTTQAAISQYINSKRAFKGAQQFGKVLPKIEATAKKTAKQLMEKQTTWAEVTVDLCRLCLEFSCEEANTPLEHSVEDYAI
jgi:predicted transcriptional regulator